MTARKAIEQQLAVVEAKAPLFVHACPGAGKTRVLVDRFIAHVEKNKSKGIAVLSFTNRAAEEVSNRASESSRRALRFPHFVGTFDRFIATYIARPHLRGPVQIVESWQRLGVNVAAKGVKGSFSLDHFIRQSDGSLSYQPRPTSLAIDEEQRGRLEHNAGKQLQDLHSRGYFSCADIRIETCRLLQDETIIDRLVHRFAELMVDEAQDCAADELAILGRLHGKGLPLFVVCDPHQAIYEWRKASPRMLSEFVKPFPQLSLVSNWRSSPAICSLGASVRGTDDRDVSVGVNSSNSTPLYILPYTGALSTQIGERFLALLGTEGIDPREALVLAHGTRHATNVVGGASKEVTSTPARLARAASSVVDHRQTQRQRSSGIAEIERIIGQFLKINMEGKSVDQASEEEGIDRWDWKVSAARVAAGVNAIGWDSQLIDWLPKARDTLIAETEHFNRVTIAPKVFLKIAKVDEPKPASSLVGMSGSITGLRHSTVHDAKGSEADAVLMVLPPDRKPQNRTSALLDKWEGRIDDEAKRILYVGITRARILCALTVSEAVKDRLITVLKRDGVSFRIA